MQSHLMRYILEQPYHLSFLILAAPVIAMIGVVLKIGQAITSFMPADQAKALGESVASIISSAAIIADKIEGQHEKLESLGGLK